MAELVGVDQRPASKPVRVATTGQGGGTGLFATILAKLGGFAIEEVVVNSTLAVALEAVGEHVDAAVVNTYDIKLFNMMSHNSLVPIITSGAARSPDFPDTPTIGEVTGDRTLDFTTSVSVFASRAMNDSSRRAAHTSLPRSREGVRSHHGGNPDEFSSAGRRPRSG